MSGWVIVATALAGGAGSAARFLLDTAVRRRLGTRFPWGISTINITGSFALGLVTGLGTLVVPGELITIVGTGLIGGYTTFSTASVDAVRLALDCRPAAAILNGFGNLAACVLAAMLGLWLVAR